jgi:hypothetical protein
MIQGIGRQMDWMKEYGGRDRYMIGYRCNFLCYESDF